MRPRSRPSYAEGVPVVELLYWEGCPSHPHALAELRSALAELGRRDVDVVLTEIATDEQFRTIESRLAEERVLGEISAAWLV